MRNKMLEFRFSPIKNKAELLKAIEYVHTKCALLCQEKYGEFLPVAGNIGIFSHFPDEYEFLVNLRKEMTFESNHWNNKYYLLREPIVVQNTGVPSATYTHLYIRHPDDTKPEVGDVDYVLEKEKYLSLKKSLQEGRTINGLEILDRPDLDLIKIPDPEFEVLSFIGFQNIEESIKSQNML